MLDTIATMIAQALNVTDAEVAETRDRLLEEQAAGGRYAASTALEHPEGSTTALPEAAMRAQNSYAALRKRVEKELPRALSLVLAAEIARERRDEAEKARDLHWKMENDRLDTGVHDATRGHFKRLFQHGVHPHNLKQHRNDEVAIFADLTRWKASDPKMLDPDNPWRDILGIYTTRLMLRPGYGVTVTRSVPGIATPPARAGDPDHYMFAAMLTNVPVVAPRRVFVPVPAVAAQPPAAGDSTTEAEADTIDLVDEVQGEDAEVATGPVEHVAADDGGPLPDPYELPADMPQDVWDALMEAAERAVADDPDWSFDLMVAIGTAAEETEEAVIAAVASATDVQGATPFRYFVDVAKSDGAEIGYHAYKGATVRRIAFEMATAKPAGNLRSDTRLTNLVSMLSRHGRVDDPPSR